AGRYNDLTLTIDLAPTILTAAGVQVPRPMQGLNLLDVAAGKGRLNRNAVFGEIYVHTATMIGRPDLDVTHRWMREGDWKLIVQLREKGPELYNLAKDPRTDQPGAAGAPIGATVAASSGSLGGGSLTP